MARCFGPYGGRYDGTRLRWVEIGRSLHRTQLRDDELAFLLWVYLHSIGSVLGGREKCNNLMSQDANRAEFATLRGKSGGSLLGWC